MVVAGFAAMLFGLLPRFSWLAWAMIAVVWVGLLGIIIGLPDWTSNLSPLGHDALVPAADLAVTPLVILSLIALALFAAAFRGFQRRDIPGE
jgi:ABC-2 type transport system permease protein